MYRVINRMRNIHAFIFITPWCPVNRLELYKVIILSAHVSGIGNNFVSFLGVITSVNNKESNNMYFYANVSTFTIADVVFCARYKYKSLKYRLINYPAYISFTVAGKYVPFRAFLCITFNILLISACLAKMFTLICL